MCTRFLRLLLTVLIVSTSGAAVFGTLALAQDESSTERVEAGGAPPPGSGTVETSTFVRAIDGDTVETWIGTTRVGIGIIGIDAPEGNTICGMQARGYLQGLVYGGLRLEEDEEIFFDSANRRMYYALTPGGDSIAAMMVSSGLAIATGEGRDAGSLLALQEEAERTQTGCFANPDANLNEYGTPEEVNQSTSSSLMQASVLPPDLTQDVIVSGLSFPTSFSMLPDGRILIGEKSGRIRIFKDGSLLSTPFIDISAQVNDYWDRGLLNVAVDPAFEVNGYVYLLYTYENNPSAFSGAKTGRLIRVTASGDTASLGSAVVLLGSVVGSTCPSFTSDCIPSDAASHSTGGIAFGSDGSLFVTLGEGAGFNVVDPDALRAQHPDSLGGKLLRITNTGQGLPDNPFYTGNPNDNRSKIWASGLRNAYRLGVRPENDIPYVGDVGWTTWEEVSVARAGANLGWPCYEGPARQGGYEPLSVCQDLYAQGASAVQPPLTYWNHMGGGSAVTGGVFISSILYPETYRNAYVYADYVAGTISYLHVDANDNLTSGPTMLVENAGGPVDFEIGPDGYLYYLSINSGEIRRLRPTQTGTNPGEEIYISDLTFVSASNGWGPVERDMSNGEDAAGDGNPLSIRGSIFEKGLGVHSPSTIEVAIPETCPTFSAVIGIDDEVAPNGTVTFEVWGDATRLFSSEILSGTSTPEPINVDLTGHAIMRLVVTYGGDNTWWDHANWADARFVCGADDPPPPPPPPPPPDGEDVYVSDLPWISATNGWGPAERDMSNGESGAGDGGPLTMAGVVYEKGIGVHALSDIRVDITGMCPYLHAVIGIDDEVGSLGSVRFEVYGDGTRLYESGILTGTSTPEAIMVDLSGYGTLRLIVNDSGDNVFYDHANWAIAMLSCSETPPGSPDPDPDPPPPTGGLFGTPTSYNSGTNSHGVIAADVTGNGRLDMLVANAGGNTVSVFPGNGDGSFGTPAHLDVGGLAPKMVTVGDVNNDGIPDLLTANQDSNGIGILLGTGGGSFAPAFQISTCQRAHEVALADLNGDGNLDIATACWDDDHVSVRLGNGDGTFGDAAPYFTGAVSHSVQIADFNGDGNLDLVADDYWAGRVHVFLGNGDGTFGSSTTYSVGSGPHGVRVADVNGDGNLDIVTANDLAGTVSLLLGNGNGTFQPQSLYTVNPRPKSVAIGDVTGDGQLDIVVANSWGNYGASTFVPTDISVLRGTGSGGFAPAEHFAIDLTPFSVTIADFNGDGRNDVAVALWHSNSVAVFLNQAN